MRFRLPSLILLFLAAPLLFGGTPGQLQLTINDGSGVPRNKPVVVENGKVLSFNASLEPVMSTGDAGSAIWGAITGTLADQTDLGSALAAKQSITGLDGYFADPSTNASFSASAWRTDLGLVIGTNVQAYSANLTTYAAIAPSANVQTLLGAADYSAFRTSLGLGSLATQSGTFSGTSSGTNTGDQTIALTGDVTGSGTGSFAATLATVNANTGSFGSDTAIPSFTVNGKGLITAASTNAVIAPAGTLTGTTLAANVVTSSLTSVGALTSGSINWNGNIATTGSGSFGALSGTTGTFSDSLSVANSQALFFGGQGSDTYIVGTAASDFIQFKVGGATSFTAYASTFDLGSNALTAGAGSFTTLAATTVRLTGYSGSATQGLINFEASGTTDYIYYNASSLAFRLGNIDRMNLTTTGLAVTGTVGATGAIYAGTADSDSQGRFGAKFAGSATLNGLSLIESATYSGAGYAVFKKSDGTTIGSITRVTTTDAVAYNTTSDGRLKTNVRDFTAADSGRIIDGLKPRWFDWKASDLTETVEEEVATDKQDGDGKPVMEKRSKQRKVTDPKRIAAHVENNKSIIGFIAQEEAAVDPALVRIGAVTVGDDDPTTITKQWSRSDAALVPVLVAEVKSLRARVATLEQESKRLDALEARIAALEKK